MALDYTTDAVLSSAYGRCMENVAALTPTDMLRIFNEEVTGYLMPLVLESRQDYFTNTVSTPFVSGTSIYFIPDGASAEEVRIIGILDPNNNICAALVHMDLEQVLQQGTQAQQQVGTFPTNYYFSGSDTITVWPPMAVQSNGYSLAWWFFQRPAEVVFRGACAQISAINYAGGTVTLTLSAPPGAPNYLNTSTPVPAAWTTSTVVDLVKSRPPFTRQVTAVTLTAVTSTTVAYAAAAAPTNILVGDYVVPTGQSCFFTGFPGEAITGPLTQWATVKLMEGRGDDSAFGRAIKTLSVNENRFKQFMRKRNTGAVEQAYASTSKYKGQILGRRFF